MAIRITKVYTKAGDGGSTHLAGGQKRAKTDPRIEAYGTVDELNATLGLAAVAAAATPASAELARKLARIQNELFDLGSMLAVLPQDRVPQMATVGASDVARLEAEIDAMNETLSPLNSFVLPGGGELGARLHLARTVCRRAERRVLALNALEPLDEHIVPYLNRLSDWLFVASRHACQLLGVAELLWRPGDRG